MFCVPNFIQTASIFLPLPKYFTNLLAYSRSYTMYYRCFFSSKETPSTTTNHQKFVAYIGSKTYANIFRDSYDYGYGGGRTDLPAVGYNPVYPSQQGSTTTGSTYRQAFDSNPYASQQYGYQAVSSVIFPHARTICHFQEFDICQPLRRVQSEQPGQRSASAASSAQRSESDHPNHRR